MNKPKMIIFDFGDKACVNETEPDFLNGTRKILELADGSNGTAAEEVQVFAEELLKEIINDEQKVQRG